MSRYEVAWSFETARFRTELRIYPCDTPPEDAFDDPRDVEAIRSESIAYFDAVVAVVDVGSGQVVGRDSLGCCAYRDVEEFYTSHRDSDPMNRNSSIMRAHSLHTTGHAAVICHYFPDMVAQAVKDAHQNIGRLCAAVKH